MRQLSFILLLTVICIPGVYANDIGSFQRAYPDKIIAVDEHYITWADGSKMPLSEGKAPATEEDTLNNPSLIDQINNIHYDTGIPANPVTYQPAGDPGRIRYEPFFLKMYGKTKEEVQANLTTVYWMPHFFNYQYPLQVSKINRIDEKFKHISDELAALVRQHPNYLVFLENPGGTFCWRHIANTQRMSLHSFGMTIDINTEQSNYWQWDLENAGLSPAETTPPLSYQNHIPWDIVAIFEKYGFIWGGKWRHYDTMHFEYRPELLA